MEVLSFDRFKYSDELVSSWSSR